MHSERSSNQNSCNESKILSSLLQKDPHSFRLYECINGVKITNNSNFYLNVTKRKKRPSNEQELIKIMVVLWNFNSSQSLVGNLLIQACFVLKRGFQTL